MNEETKKRIIEKTGASADMKKKQPRFRRTELLHKIRFAAPLGRALRMLEINLSAKRIVSMNEETKKRIIEKLEECGCFAPLDCGYIHFWPASGGVAMSAAVLRFIADELDRRNADWDKQVQEQSE